eukprot:1643766-Pyramimonas_sp.AAC.1
MTIDETSWSPQGQAPGGGNCEDVRADVLGRRRMPPGGAFGAPPDALRAPGKRAFSADPRNLRRLPKVHVDTSCAAPP